MAPRSKRAAEKSAEAEGPEAAAAPKRARRGRTPAPAAHEEEGAAPGAMVDETPLPPSRGRGRKAAAPAAAAAAAAADAPASEEAAPAARGRRGAAKGESEADKKKAAAAAAAEAAAAAAAAEKEKEKAKPKGGARRGGASSSSSGGGGGGGDGAPMARSVSTVAVSSAVTGEKLEDAGDFKGADVVFSFDTTGSMYPCLSELRVHIVEMVERLFREVPNLRIGVIAHGDYCDGDRMYSQLDLSEDRAAIVKFVRTVHSTSGGDFPEAYEVVLNRAQLLSWRSPTCRALVLIGDAIPHEPDDIKRQGHKPVDWREEAKELLKMGVNIYSVQCLHGGPMAHTFYKQIAAWTNGYHLRLHQFARLRDILLAICFRQIGAARLSRFEQELSGSLGGLTDNMRRMFDVLLKRTAADFSWEAEEEAAGHAGWGYTARGGGGGGGGVLASRKLGLADKGEGIRPCAPTRFQVLEVTPDDPLDIKGFTENRGLRFQKGRCFYEFTKAETVQSYKEVVLMDRATGNLFEGKGARDLLGLGDSDARISPEENKKFRIFVQSTSVNRKLVPGTGFLYEVPADAL